MKRIARIAALPLALGTLGTLLLCGGFAQTSRLWPWLILSITCAGALVQIGLREKKAVEHGLLCGLIALALSQLSPPLQPLLYLFSAGATLLLPLAISVPLLCAILGLDWLLAKEWPVWLAHASFAALFASLYHALLGARLSASRKAESQAVKKRVAEAEERARELRLLSSPEAEAQLLAGVSEVEEALRSSLNVARAALRPHSVAVFLLSPEGDSVRLRECLSESEKLFRGPLPSREGAIGAVLSAARPVKLEGAAQQLSYYEGRAPVGAFCGVPLGDLGVLVADRVEAFADADQQVLEALAAELLRAVAVERLLGTVRREKEEKARFFEALEALNRTTTAAQAAQTAIEQARRMCPSLDLCVLTLKEDRRHRVLAADGEGASALESLSFADNAGLVSNVVKLGAPLPGRDVSQMDRLVVFDTSTVLRGFRTLKIFPLRAGEKTVGTLVCGSRAVEPLPSNSLSMLALQAAEALIRARLYEESEKLATTDGLTGLANRRNFNATLEQRLKESARYGRPLSLLLLDVDHFKKVNDTHGHPAGDAVLKGVARIVQKAARDTDVAARYGGEEMALILPETDARGARAIAERLRKLIEAASHATEQGALRVTVSIGVATGASSPAEMIEQCDRALYKAKRNGRNKVECAIAKAAA
jgi:two-component system, cell cycle response regulator